MPEVRRSRVHYREPSIETVTPSIDRPLKVSIIFSTGRAAPRLDWVIDGLEAQAHPDDEIELIVVDGYEHSARTAESIGYRPISCIKRVVTTSPKPSIWQGTHRVTACDWWAMSNARNTGTVLANQEYLAFLDDRARLGPRWLEVVRRGERARDSVIAGSYEKRDGDGRLLATDFRSRKHPRGLIDCTMAKCQGCWLFGCTFALPLAWLLECNGHEEGADGIGVEDCVLGFMLANNRHRIDFVPDMFVSQDRMAGTVNTFARLDKGKSPKDKSHALIERYQGCKRTEFTPDLIELRRRIATGEGWPVPDPSVDHRDWYDGQLIREMKP